MADAKRRVWQAWGSSRTQARNDPTQRVRIKAQDREFLPPALAVTTTPPSPVRIVFGSLICLFFAAAIALAWLGQIDIYAVASGRIQPIGRSKLVQPVDGGKVVVVNVRDGMHVKEGQLLAKLDSTQVLAERDSVARHLATLTAEIARRKTAIDYVLAGTITPSVPRIEFPKGIDAALQGREQAVLIADLAELSANLDSTMAKISENTAKQKALEATIAARSRTIETISQRVQMREDLEKQGWETRANVLEVAEDLRKEQASQSSDEGDLLQTVAAITTLERQLAETKTKFVSDYSQALEMAEETADMVSQDLVKANTKLEDTDLTAPIAGTVQELAITTIGQVVNASQQVMTIVPDASSLEIEALVQNQDIGFVQLGQPVVIKVDSFPFTRYGTVSGKVTKVSREAVDQNEAFSAADTQAKPITPASSSSAAASTPSTQNLVYPVTVALDTATMNIDGVPTALAPGMTARVEIQTGRRSVLEYILSPFEETLANAVHER